MPKIIKNGREYSGTPLEEVTAWPPTGDSVQIEQPLMGNTDISEIGDGTVTGAISELNNGLTYSYGPQINIMGYNSSSNEWTAPQDGYVYAQVWNADSTLDVWFDKQIFVVNLKNSTAGYCRSYATFVKKGMTMWFGGGGTNRSCYFTPLLLR